MKELICENCGNKNFVEENGIPTCKSCGAKYPEFSLSKVGIEEELREKEIRRLVKANEKGLTFRPIRLVPIICIGFFTAYLIIVQLYGNVYNYIANIVSFLVIILFSAILYFLNRFRFFHEGKSDLEPSLNILTNDEILKYAPKSNAARKIRSKKI